MEYSSFVAILYLYLLKERHDVTGLCNCSSSTHSLGEILPLHQCGECKTNGSRNDSTPSCPLWYEIDPDNQGKCICRKKQLLASLKCDSEVGGQGLLQLGQCMAYDGRNRKNAYTIGMCPYYQFKGPNVTREGYVKLPDNVSQLNNYLCQIVNRTGPMCHQCIPGFGPSLTSMQFQCTNCTENAWYGAFLYVLVEFIPLTLFYIFILAFRIHITSAPMTCFITYGQTVLILWVYGRSDEKVNYVTSIIDARVSQNLLIFYSTINLEFLHYIVPPFCIGSSLRDIHIILLGYISALYPLCLIFLSWVSIELHDRNFRPLVLLWKPFHKCCVRLRKGWNPKNDLIDAFSSFFLFSYSKILYQSILLVGCCRSVTFNESGTPKELLYTKCFDPSILCEDKGHLKITIPATIIFLIFNILPGLLLILYPIKVFRACLSRCRLDGIAITLFVQRFHCCYRDGLNGGRDMRSLSGLYFVLRFYVLIYYLFPFINNVVSLWMCNAFFLMVTALFIAYCQPYVKKYMTILDVLLLVNTTIISLLYLLPSSAVHANVIVGLILLPALVFILILVSTTIFRISQKFTIWCHRCCCPCGKLSQAEEEIYDQRLLAPVVASVASYGTCE